MLNMLKIPWGSLYASLDFLNTILQFKIEVEYIKDTLRKFSMPVWIFEIKFKLKLRYLEKVLNASLDF